MTTMNETGTAAPAMSDNAGLFTTAHLTILVILVIAAILVIWWGSRRSRPRPPRDIGTPPLTTERTAAPEPVAPPPSPPPLADTTTGALVEPESAAPEPAPPVPAAPPAAGDAGEPVTRLKGLGPKVAARLAELGITTVGQIAALSPAEAEALDADLGSFSGRMTRDRWIEQAQLLAAGDRAVFEARFGKLG
jgi:predicted flap endonuclease-1-like 5' DNA nuclease